MKIYFFVVSVMFVAEFLIFGDKIDELRITSPALLWNYVLLAIFLTLVTPILAFGLWQINKAEKEIDRS